MRILQWAQNQAFGCGVFCPSSEVQEQRMKHSAEWTGYMVKTESAKDFKGLPIWLRQAIMHDIEERMGPPKHESQNVGVADIIEKKQA